MQERDLLAFRAESGLLVDETNAGRATATEHGGQVVHDEAHVVNAGAAFGDELANG